MCKKLLSTRDVAERLQINIRTAQRIIRSIPHINIGTGKKNEHLRITEELLERYIEEHTVFPSCPVFHHTKPIQNRQKTPGNGRIARRPSG